MEAADPPSLPTIADDLAAIEREALGNPPLRAALTDTSVPGRVRRDVMLEVLEGKVSAAARRLAAFACLVVPAPEVPGALGWLATRAAHEAEGMDAVAQHQLARRPALVGEAIDFVAGHACQEHEGFP